MKEQNIYHKTKVELEQEWCQIQLAQKSADAFKPIYDQYFVSIFRFVYQRLDDKDTARDITQQTFYAALKSIGNYKYTGKPYSAYLYRIALNELNLYFRKNSNAKTINIDQTTISNISEEMPDENLLHLLDKIKICLPKLKDLDFRFLEMRFFENKSFKEIGDIMEITENNAKVKTYRVLDKLKALFLNINASNA